MGTYERKVNQLKDLMRRKYKSAYNKSKEMDIDIRLNDISSMPRRI